MRFQIFAVIASALSLQVSAAPADNAVIPPEAENGPRYLPKTFAHSINGALDKVGYERISKSTNANRVRITYANRDNTSIVIGHSLAQGSPNPRGYDRGIGEFHLQPGQDSTIEYPEGYRGVSFVNLDSPGYRLTYNDESGIEISYVNAPYVGLAGDVDITYVDGFSRADDNGVGSCRNPKRWDNNAREPTEFFRPCTYHGGAFTYPQADANTLYGGCPSENYVCCIGHGDECLRYNGHSRK